MVRKGFSFAARVVSWLVVLNCLGSTVYAQIASTDLPGPLIPFSNRKAAEIVLKGRDQLRVLVEKDLILDGLNYPRVCAWVSPEGYKQLEVEGWSISWLPPEAEPAPIGIPKGSLAFPLEAYPTYDQIGALLEEYALNYSSLCRVESIGSSAEGRNLWVIRITDHPEIEEDEPECKLISTIHGNETLGTVVMLDLVHELLTEYENDLRIRHLVDETEIWILPLMNPDGYSHTPRARFNYNGYDLNRNFPDRVEDPANTTAGRQPETSAVMEFTRDHSFVLSANFHTGSQVVNYPYDSSAYWNTWKHPDWYTPDQDVFVQNSLAYSTHNPLLYSSGQFTQGISNGLEWYQINGGMQDWNYVWHRSMEVTIELSNLFSPPASQLVSHWEANRESLLSYLEQSRIGIRGIIRNSQNGKPIPASVEVSGREGLVHTDPQVGDYHRLLLPGTYTLQIQAQGFYPLTVHGVAVQSGTASRVDVDLDPAYSGWLIY